MTRTFSPRVSSCSTSKRPVAPVAPTTSIVIVLHPFMVEDGPGRTALSIRLPLLSTITYFALNYPYLLFYHHLAYYTFSSIPLALDRLFLYAMEGKLVDF